MASATATSASGTSTATGSAGSASSTGAATGCRFGGTGRIGLRATAARMSSGIWIVDFISGAGSRRGLGLRLDLRLARAAAR